MPRSDRATQGFYTAAFYRNMYIWLMLLSGSALFACIFQSFFYSTRWRTLPAEQTAGIKGFIVNLVIAKSSDEAQYRGAKLFMSKLNVILVQIVKQEWPHNWPSFISDIVNASKTNETLCENNMIILKLLSEEVCGSASQPASPDFPARDPCRLTRLDRDRGCGQLRMRAVGSPALPRSSTFRATR